MNLDFSEEQVMLRDMVARLCDDQHGSEVIRKLEQDAVGYLPGFWEGLAEAGLCGVGIEEMYGGIGLGSLEVVILHEEMGRVLAPSPHLVSCVIAAQLLQTAGTDAQKEALLPGIASGQLVVVAAWQENGASARLDAVQGGLSEHATSLCVNADKVLVPFANSADYFLVPVRDENACIRIVLVAAGRAVLRVQPNHADQNLYAVSFPEVMVCADDVLCDENVDVHWDKAMLRGQLAIAAQAVGGATSLLQMTIQYARKREQFGQPIGAFQAIAHYLADRATELEGARYLVYQAAWACDQRETGWERLALMAKLQATAVFRRVTVTGVQVHGGMGFSSEADPQLYYRRAKHLQLMHWDPRYVEQRIAKEVFA